MERIPVNRAIEGESPAEAPKSGVGRNVMNIIKGAREKMGQGSEKLRNAIKSLKDIAAVSGGTRKRMYALAGATALGFEQLEKKDLMATIIYDGQFVPIAQIGDEPVGLQVQRMGEHGEINIAHTLGTLVENNHAISLIRASIVQPEGSQMQWDTYLRQGGAPVSVINPDLVPDGVGGPRIDLITNMNPETGTQGYAIPVGETTTFDQAILGNMFEAEFWDETAQDTIILRAPVTQFSGTQGIQTSPPQPELEGDFNKDGSVDAADYVALRKMGAPTEDFDSWSNNFGETAQMGGGASVVHTQEGGVPEAQSAALAGVGSSILYMLNRNKRERLNRVFAQDKVLAENPVIASKVDPALTENLVDSRKVENKEDASPLSTSESPRALAIDEAISQFSGRKKRVKK